MRSGLSDLVAGASSTFPVLIGPRLGLAGGWRCPLGA
jgi:hypothetical protein